MSATLKAAILALKGRIADAYTAISNKGGTLPATQDSANLATAIASIPSGVMINLDGYSFNAEGTDHPKNIYDLMFNNGRIYSVYDENNYDANHGFSRYTQPRINGFFLGARIINLPNQEYLPSAFVCGNTLLEEFYAPKAKVKSTDTTRFSYQFPASAFSYAANSNLRIVDLGEAQTIYGSVDYLPFAQSFVNLIDVRLRLSVAIADDYTFRRCVQTNAIDANSTSLLTPEDIAAGFTSNRQKWNWNMREHIAKVSIDITGQTTRYLYIPQAQYDALESATIQEFANKGWGIAVAS